MQNAVSDFRHLVITHTLGRSPVFGGLANGELDSIVAITVSKSLAKGEYLFHEGSPVHGLYIVQKGAIKLHRVTPKGKEQLIHIFRPTESFGEETLVSDTGQAADACALVSSEVLLVQKAGFLCLLQRRPDLVLRLLRSVSGQFRALVGRLDDLTLKDVKTRLATWLIRQCPDPASYEPFRIHLATTKSVLAAELGTVSETLSRTVAKFRDEKLLAVEGNAFTLLCPTRLARLCGDEDGVGTAPHPAGYGASALRSA